MKLNIHRNEERGSSDYGWLKSKHCYSFGEYFNPVREDFGVVRVLNDELLEPDSLFGLHHQKNLEVILLPLKGNLFYSSSNGFTATLSNEEVLITSAGSGIDHSFGNSSPDESLALIQIWIYSKIKDIQPRNQMLLFPAGERRNQLQIIAQPDIISDVLWINQDVQLARIDITPGHSFQYKMHDEENLLLVFVIDGEIKINDSEALVKTRDTVELTGPDEYVKFYANELSKLLIIESVAD